MGMEKTLTYSIFDPTGNITALVESPAELSRQPEIAAAVMRRHPTVEQVGFLSRTPEGADVQGQLRMAGGEFCGNASMCAAALLLMQTGPAEGEARLRLRVSGAAQPVEVSLRREGEDRFRAEVFMPPAREIGSAALAFEGLRGEAPLVRMQGISHLILEPDSVFFSLLKDRPAAERAVRAFCSDLAAEGLGMLFLDGRGADMCLTPLVFVPGSGTVFWGNSCASGSAAAGMFFTDRYGAAAELSLYEPGGVLRVYSDPKRGVTRLTGCVRFLERCKLPEME